MEAFSHNFSDKSSVLGKQQSNHERLHTFYLIRKTFKSNARLISAEFENLSRMIMNDHRLVPLQGWSIAFTFNTLQNALGEFPSKRLVQIQTCKSNCSYQRKFDIDQAKMAALPVHLVHDHYRFRDNVLYILVGVSTYYRFYLDLSFCAVYCHVWYFSIVYELVALL